MAFTAVVPGVTLPYLHTVCFVAGATAALVLHEVRREPQSERLVGGCWGLRAGGVPLSSLSLVTDTHPRSCTRLRSWGMHWQRLRRACASSGWVSSSSPAASPSRTCSWTSRRWRCCRPPSSSPCSPRACGITPCWWRRAPWCCRRCPCGSPPCSSPTKVRGVLVCCVLLHSHNKHRRCPWPHHGTGIIHASLETRNAISSYEFAYSWCMLMIGIGLVRCERCRGNGGVSAVRACAAAHRRRGVLCGRLPHAQPCSMGRTSSNPSHDPTRPLQPPIHATPARILGVLRLGENHLRQGSRRLGAAL